MFRRIFFRARLKNVDRSSATYHSVTVDDFTVVITEFKPKVKKEKKDDKKNSSNENNDKKDKDDQAGPSKNGSDSNPAQPKTEPGEEPKPEPDGNHNDKGNSNPNENGNNQADSLQNSVTTSNMKVEVLNDTRSS